MTGQFVLITGCSTGIGYRAARTLQDNGYKVIASCRQAHDVARLKAEGVKRVVELDLASSDSISRAVEQVLALSQGKLYGLFNNGAYGQPGAVEDLSRDLLRQQFEVNVFGTHELTCKLLPALLTMPDARIVQNSSVLGFVPLLGRGAYCASKYALEGLTDTLRLELRDTNVKVSLLEPGPIATQFRANALRALRSNIDYRQSRHQPMYRAAEQRLASGQSSSRFTLGPEAVVEKLLLALTDPRPKARYRVTVPTQTLSVLKRLLSTNALDRFIARFGQA